MHESDTIKLLRECDAGVQMAIESFDEMLDDVQDCALRACLLDNRNKHDRILSDIKNHLMAHSDCGKELSPVAKGMAWFKTNAKLAMDHSDATIANLITDGCNMGVKSLNQYLNEFSQADESAKEITRRLIFLEETLSTDLRPYL